MLCLGTLDLTGGAEFTGKLPQSGNRPVAGKAKGRGKAEREDHAAAAAEPASLVAVVAGRLGTNDQLEAGSLTVLTDLVKPGSATITWPVPAGQWRLMAFWLKFTGQECQAQSAKPRRG